MTRCCWTRSSTPRTRSRATRTTSRTSCGWTMTTSGRCSGRRTRSSKTRTPGPRGGRGDSQGLGHLLGQIIRPTNLLSFTYFCLFRESSIELGPTFPLWHKCTICPWHGTCVNCNHSLMFKDGMCTTAFVLHKIPLQTPNTPRFLGSQ